MLKKPTRTLLTSIQGKNAENWIGQVKDVTSGFLESIWITTAVDNVEFHLYPDDKDKAKNFVSNLNQGDWVLYSGVIDGESSLTISGAIDVPEIKITFTSAASGRYTYLGSGKKK